MLLLLRLPLSSGPFSLCLPASLVAFLSFPRKHEDDGDPTGGTLGWRRHLAFPPEISVPCPPLFFQISSGSLTGTSQATQWALVTPVTQMHSSTRLFLEPRLSMAWGMGTVGEQRGHTVPLRSRHPLLLREGACPSAAMISEAKATFPSVPLTKAVAGRLEGPCLGKAPHSSCPHPARLPAWHALRTELTGRLSQFL